jgi:hypothetical protein
MTSGLVTTCVALVLFAAVPVMAGAATDNVQLTLGQFTADESGARQALVVRNDGPDAFNIVVSCGFLRGDVAVAEAHESVLNVNQGKTAYAIIVAANATGATRADCRVVLATPLDISLDAQLSFGTPGLGAEHRAGQHSAEILGKPDKPDKTQKSRKHWPLLPHSQ